MFRRIAPALAATLVLSLAAVTPAHAGPPWISIELPANPLDRATRDAYLVVHTYHHAAITDAMLSGRAIGLVDGQRRELKLAFARTSRPGVYTLRRSWPEDGAWALVISVGEGEGEATVLVGVGPDGAVRSVRVPTQELDGRTWPRPVTRDDIDGTLRTVARDGTGGSDRAGLALLGGALLLPLAAGVLRSRQRR